MPRKRDVDKEWKKLGIETDWVTRARIRGTILPACPWLDAAQRMVTVVGRPAAELTKLFAQQLDLYSLSPEEEAHKEFERKVEEGTSTEKVKLNLAMAAYTGSPVTPINPVVYEWASQVVETTHRYRDETYQMLQEVASMPRLVKVGTLRLRTYTWREKIYELYTLYIPRYKIYLNQIVSRDMRTGEWLGVYRTRSAILEEYRRRYYEALYSSW